MVRHKKKITKLRGTRTVGGGNKKSRRGKGSRMGRGSIKKGGQRNKQHILKYEPERLHKKGFKSLKPKLKTINLNEIEKIAEKEEVNLIKKGYEKVLGRGDITQPLKITAKKFTKKAVEKIKKAGGEAIIIGEKG